MARPKKETGGLTVKVGNAISDGNGGWFSIGDVIDVPDKAAAEELKAKGLVE